MGEGVAFEVPAWLTGLQAIRGGTVARTAEAPPAALPVRISQAEVRHCSILAVEIQGLDAVQKALPPDEAQYIEHHVFQLMFDTLNLHDGVVEPGKGEPWGGDAVGYFGARYVDERISDRAAHAAVVLRDKIHSTNEVLASKGLALTTRAGIYYAEATLEPPPDSAELRVVGKPVDCARELRKNAKPDSIMITQRMAVFLGEAFLYGASQDIYFEPLDATLTIVEVTGVNPQSPDPWIHRRGRLVTPFYGRTDELDLLLDAYEQAKTGTAKPIFWVKGAQGLGKSRLLNELRARLALASAKPLVLFANYPEYSPGVLGLFETLFVHASVYLRAEVVSLLHEAALDPERKKEAYITAMKSFHRGLNAPPLVLMIDDMDRADAETIEFLTRAIPEVQPAQNLVCYFSAGRSFQIPAGLLPPGGFPPMDLEPLPERIIVQILDYLCRHWHMPYTLFEDLLEKCEGNPLYLEDLFYYRVEGGFVSRDKTGNWVWAHPPESFAAPAHLNDLLLSELNPLSPDSRRLLQWCSVLSQPFRFSTLEVLAGQFLPGMKPKDLEKALLILSDQGFLRLFIRRSDKAVETGRFTSELLRQALERTVLKTNKQLLVETAGG